MTAREVVVVETGMGNLRSVERALLAAAAQAGLTTTVAHSGDPERVARAERLIVPGQGGFGEGARALAGGLGEALCQAISRGTPYFGICLGLQLLFESSAEAPGAAGLGVFSGRCEPLTPAPGVNIPHMGWNCLEAVGEPHPNLRELFASAPGAEARAPWAYFVHSYHAVPSDADLLCAVVTHGPHRVTAAVARENVFATQFHPEKSHAAGLGVLAAFLRG